MGGPVVLHGHGLRDRQVRGIEAPFVPPVLQVVRARRYACQRCGAIVLVVPAAVGRRRLFDLATIAYALARWLVEGAATRTVRAETSPLRFVGDSARRAWSQLRRWGRAAADILGPPRPVAVDGSAMAARTVIATVAALAPPSWGARPVCERAFAAMAMGR